MRAVDYPRWIRGRLGGETVVDSKRAKLLYLDGRKLPVYGFPAEDVRLDAVPRDAITRHDDVLQVDFGALDEWLEEDQPQLGHPPDVFHRIDVRPTSRHVRISIRGRVVAETTRARALFETGLPVRWYIPREDVVADLEPSDHRTVCAYKGYATHFDVAGEGAIAWSYADPLHDGEPIRDLIAFYDERVEVEIDGHSQQPPDTQWSAGRSG
jgi:uncharacterized protein (DUF427 family)